MGWRCIVLGHRFECAGEFKPIDGHYPFVTALAAMCQNPNCEYIRLMGNYPPEPWPKPKYRGGNVNEK